MLFTREELVEMGLLSPELPSNPRQLETELPSNPRHFDEVATSGLPDCQMVASEKQQVATDLSLYIIYTYLSRLLGCKINKVHLREYNEKYRIKTILLPCNLATEIPADFAVSLWNKYSCADFVPVASPEATLQPETVDSFCDRIQHTHFFASLVQDVAYFELYKAEPGDEWDGSFTDDGLTVDSFQVKQSRVCTSEEILEAADMERQRVRPGRTMLSLMYAHNVQDWTWFEGHDGQWHCFNHTGLK